MKIISMGGGEISELETLELDHFVCSQTLKLKPSALFIPTASGDAEGYCETFHYVYGQRLGCRVDALLATGSDFSKKEATQKIMNADLVYVGGGNTQRMLEIWRRFGIDEALRRAGENGTILSGLSAGGICWYESGLSDSDRFAENSSWSLRRIDALGFVPGLFCPHLDKEQRHAPLYDLVLASGERAIACDNGAAVYWDNGVARALTSIPNAYVYVYTKNSEAVQINRYENDGKFEL
ncbi:peptidase E [Pseudomonas aeruginosa]|uniref:Type 1 glutamine amidotransferase-like domain-containing protein n=1 Tax=Pseudomonas aeruginosa TaxID=287 RepID=UPI0013CE23E6|nr:peptidase E [Pseudomonas aeruginosa]